MKKEDRPHVARAFWDSFCTLSGEQRDMTCAEWYVLSGWMDRQIPLTVILTAFEEFQGQAAAAGRDGRAFGPRVCVLPTGDGAVREG